MGFNIKIQYPLHYKWTFLIIELLREHFINYLFERMKNNNKNMNNNLSYCLSKMDMCVFAHVHSYTCMHARTHARTLHTYLWCHLYDVLT